MIRELLNGALAELIEKSRVSPRKRAPMPLHPSDYSGPQALINAIQPDSYMCPHMHPHDEIWTPVRGRILLGIFDNEGNPRERAILSEQETAYRLVPARVYHFAFALERDSVFLNVSQGPFNPETAKVFAPWAPRETDSEDDVQRYFASVKDDFLWTIC
mgnify:CR=1 FL=1